MKSSRAEKFLSNKPVYALIAVYMPMLFVASFVFLFGELISDLVAFNALYPLLGAFASALAATIYYDFMKDSKAGRIAADVRGAVLVMLTSYLISSMFYGIGSSLLKMILPNLHNVIALLAALYAWDAVLSLKQLFSARKIFDRYTKLYSGEQLQEVLFGDTPVMQYNDEEIVRVRNSFIIQFVVVFFILLLNTVLRVPMALPLYLLMILTLESVVCFFGFLEIFRWEQYYAGEGLTLPSFDLAKRMIGISLFAIFCTIIGILWSSEKSLLNFSPIIEFFKWLFNLLRRTTVQVVDTVLEEIPIELEIFPEMPMIDVLPGQEKTPFPIVEVLQYLFLSLIITSFIWFLVAPLFKRRKGAKLSFRQRLALIIKEWIKGVLYAISSFIAFITNDKSRQRIRNPSMEEIRRATENILGAYSHAKKKDIRRSATLFARLIIWGNEVRKVAWKPVHAPAEYCSILAAASSGSGDAVLVTAGEIPAFIIRCGEIFEKAIYSAEVLTDEERKDFKELIEKITSSE